MWLKSLLDTSSYDKPGRKAVGLDIGTGASCVYPLLGCTQRPWSFLATGQSSATRAMKPVEVQDDGWSLFLLETERPLFVSEWAEGLEARKLRVKGAKL